MSKWDSLKEQARALATRKYMILKQRERVCEAAKLFCRTLDDSGGDITGARKWLEKETRKLRALEGE